MGEATIHMEAKTAVRSLIIVGISVGMVLAPFQRIYAQNLGGNAESERVLARAWCAECHRVEEGKFGVFAADFAEQPIERPSITLPRFRCLDRPDDVELEAKEAAQRVAQQRLIRQGVEAWNSIDRAASLGHWKKVGAALAVGRDHALRITQANGPHGKRYSAAFSQGSSSINSTACRNEPVPGRWR